MGSMPDSKAIAPEAFIVVMLKICMVMRMGTAEWYAKQYPNRNIPRQRVHTCPNILQVFLYFGERFFVLGRPLFSRKEVPEGSLAGCSVGWV